MEEIKTTNNSLAENKVLILYTLNTINRDITETDLLKIISSINNINYFYFRDILIDLVNSKLIGTYTKDEQTVYEITSEGKMVRIDITKYKSIVLKYGKISFIKDGFMNNAFVSNNDIIFLETKIPLFKAKDSIIIANIGKDDEKDKENNINIKSYDTLDKADLIDYSLKPNGILETSK